MNEESRQEKIVPPQCLPLGRRRATTRYSSISSNVFGPEDMNRFNCATDTARKDIEGFHPGLPVEYASQTRICCGDVDIQCGSIHQPGDSSNEQLCDVHTTRMDDDVLELQLLVPTHLFSHYKQLHVYGQMDICHAHIKQ